MMNKLPIHPVLLFLFMMLAVIYLQNNVLNTGGAGLDIAGMIRDALAALAGLR